MGFLSATAKYLLFFFNFLIIVCGLVLIVLGALSLRDQSKLITSATDGVSFVPVSGFTIGVGAVIFIIAFLGCCGAIKENACMLTTYFIILIIILILQIVLGILVFVAVKNNSNELDKKIHDAVSDIYQDYFDHPNNSTYKNAIEEIQSQFSCCGIDGYKDFKSHNLPAPDSCCKTQSNNVGTCTEQNSFKGCAKIYKDIVSSALTVVGAIAIAFALIELIGVILACVVKSRK